MLLFMRYRHGEVHHQSIEMKNYLKIRSGKVFFLYRKRSNKVTMYLRILSEMKS